MAEVRMYFARGVDGALVDVTQVPRGAACACNCLGCNAPLLAKQGSVNAWHFGHASGGSPRACAETALHLAGKELLRELPEVLIPKVCVDVTAVDALNREHARPIEAQSALFKFSSCRVEHATGTRRLDALLESKEGRLLGVEILVTHKVDESKALDLVSLNAPVLEIDLRKWVGKPLDRAALRDVLASGAPRAVVAGAAWLMEQQSGKAKEALAAELEIVACAVPRVLAPSAVGHAQSCGILERMGLASSPWPDWLDWSGWLQRQSLKHTPRKLFGVHHRVWQAACAEFLRRYPVGQKFKVQAAVASVRQCLHFPEGFDESPEYEGISAFLGEHLVNLRRVKYWGNDDHGWGDDWYQVMSETSRLRLESSTRPKLQDGLDGSTQMALF